MSAKTLCVAIKKHLLPDLSVGLAFAEIKKLTKEDRADFVRYFAEEGIEVVDEKAETAAN